MRGVGGTVKYCAVRTSFRIGGRYFRCARVLEVIVLVRWGRLTRGLGMVLCRAGLRAPLEFTFWTGALGDLCSAGCAKWWA